MANCKALKGSAMKGLRNRQALR